MEMLLIGFGLITVVEGYLIVKQRRLLDKCFRWERNLSAIKIKL